MLYSVHYPIYVDHDAEMMTLLLGGESTTPILRGGRIMTDETQIRPIQNVRVMQRANGETGSSRSSQSKSIRNIMIHLEEKHTH